MKRKIGEVIIKTKYSICIECPPKSKDISLLYMCLQNHLTSCFFLPSLLLWLFYFLCVCSLCVREIVGTIDSRIKPRTSKFVFVDLHLDNVPEWRHIHALLTSSLDNVSEWRDMSYWHAVWIMCPITYAIG